MESIANQPVRVYADPSVYGGVFDEEFAEPTRTFFDQVRAGRYRLVRCVLLEDEHVAVATASGCRLIVSWNFKHIVNFRKIPLYNGVNLTRGFSSIAIHSPQEVIEHEDQDI